ncbi:MAG TPA: tRNA (adenosine(37)-N6)-threonylcarbamoyltransferase complex dimerization subunit type 1 TsaB [Arachnia sp.]|mgnify:CR=1 FL=1|nr:tRNA (adenosine(37)-N6)-threonylcarbamoyltransferase complex dimerization subunit type 1 TsaB [Arachnia sp.]HMT85353.1 tRNA (adenosine(37)-N6)-threonylcarbamoyltransferase complex dimerization subunit type 1 TsaB [Arachnia sp.]
MTFTLGIDTSHHVAVGIARDGQILGRVVVEDTRAHAESLMPSILSAAERAGVALQDVGEIAVGMGPGPFTGLRVGIATAWSLAHVAGLEPHGVCSLDVVAREWADRGAPEEFLVVADARRKELYWARYSADGTRLIAPQVGTPEVLPGLPVAGAVPEAFADAVRVADGAPTGLDPAVLAARWAALAPAGAEPYYLRPADATVPGKPKSALPRLRPRR